MFINGWKRTHINMATFTQLGQNRVAVNQNRGIGSTQGMFNMNREDKTILILSITLFMSILVVFFITKNPAEGEYTTVLSSEQTANKKPVAQNTNPQQPTEQNIIIDLFNSTASKYGKRELKKYTLVKEQNGFKLIKMTIFSDTTKSTYDSYAIMRSSAVITGVNDEKSIDTLKKTGVPIDIINEYMRNRSDV